MRTPAARLALVALLAVLPAACAPLSGHGEEGGDGEIAYTEADDGLALTAGSVEEAMRTRCSTASVRGLSLQLVGELNAMRPGRMEPIDGIRNVELGSAVIPFLQAPAARALRNAAARRSSPMQINSALRTLPQQFLLYQWYVTGRCGIGLAARPGRSNHETGTAVDIESYGSWRSAMEGSGFRWLGGSDPVHFDYVGGGTENLASLSVLAFQRLWNRNNPGDRIAEDGAYGPATEARLRRAPASGFRIGPTGPADEPEAPPGGAAIAVGWTRRADGAYDFTATAPANVVRVEYWTDGRNRIGTVARSAGASFPVTYRFSTVATERLFEARGFDASGAQVALGIGLLDTVSGTAVFIRQTGDAEYEIGLERAPSGVAAIEVDADAFALTDATSGRTRATRLAVRSRFYVLGERTFSIRTYGVDGALRGTLRRTFTLR
ncbi:MAG: hypothetical protein OHK0013_21980 [Sandaracinaceae bacterium]